MQLRQPDHLASENRLVAREGSRRTVVANPANARDQRHRLLKFPQHGERFIRESSLVGGTKQRLFVHESPGVVAALKAARLHPNKRQHRQKSNGSLTR
ncbi:hypothetical protein Cwoe_5193 [Conexibacter woesei DSM 14684]|uniref:Uncharacterized protein n=1 Tax=Conexibacter woesei (strain DSM 14684 / CCUG 47730 / CIP 108061 / JCM 11494 / NBRC 100937 / ID131577) TaxID=469383 RepID=D3FEA9_CONWI|nr:hypothetical protein Cwoe_5193 [Conexibacter woesei DSM 14684]